jgi:hypothetical protein
MKKKEIGAYRKFFQRGPKDCFLMRYFSEGKRHVYEKRNLYGRKEKKVRACSIEVSFSSPGEIKRELDSHLVNSSQDRPIQEGKNRKKN